MASTTILAATLNLWINCAAAHQLLTCSYIANMMQGMTKSLAQTVLDEIEAFLVKHQMAHTAFGLKYNGDPSFVTRARKGRSMKASTIDGVRQFMANYKPRPRQARRAGNDRVAA